MTKALVLLALLAQGGAVALAQEGATKPAPAPGATAFSFATDIKASDVQAALEQAKATGRDAAIRIVDAGGTVGYVGASLTYRPKGGRSGGGSHETVTEVYHILEGSAIMVTGGTTVRRTDGSFPIQDGVTRKVSKGDIIIIPAGTPHGISEVLEDLTFIEFRIDPGRTIKLK